MARILEEESAEKEIAKLENRANRMQNQLETVSKVGTGVKVGTQTFNLSHS